MWSSLILLSLFVVTVTSDTCDNNRYINGCSVPRGFSWYKNKFRRACNRHDICYKCGHTLRVPRRACDVKFRRDMRSTCGRRKRGIRNIWYNIRRQECLRAADVYFAAVRTGGVLPMYWDYVSHRFCRRERWVRYCMP